ncbi:hypothetical protein F5877DRAFT_72996, partial [Lentinula edodes]
SANGTKNTSAHNSKIWSTSSVEERERIKEFWFGLGEEERRNLAKIEKDTNVDPDADLGDDEYEEEDDDGEDYEEEDEEDEEEDPNPNPNDEELSPNPNLPAHPGINDVGIGRGRGTPRRPGTTPQLGVKGGAGREGERS